MTAQIHDQLLYENGAYQIIGVKGEGLLTPHDFGMSPAMWHTACYRGYVATYACIDDGLFLSELHIGRLFEDQSWQPIQGNQPDINYSHGWSIQDGQRVDRTWEDGRIYRDLKVETYFSGGILIATGFIQSLYVHMGFGKPYQFEQVHELLFHEGLLTEAINHSEKAAAWRDQILRNNEAQEREREELRAMGLSEQEIADRLSPMPPLDDMQKDIEWRFSLDYGAWF